MKVNKFSQVYKPLNLSAKSIYKQNIAMKNKQMQVFPKGYVGSYFVQFTGSLKKPLTDEDFQKAKEYYNFLREKNSENNFSLSEIDLDKLNGIQKGIKVFEGLSMKDIAFIFGGVYSTGLLLNRGCNNNCAHCAYMATPITNKTHDKMSFEDFKSLLDGICELEERLDNKTYICHSFSTFLDSDCMNIELTDEDGNIYDYMDCLDVLKEAKNQPSLFDTSGWNPNSEKMQKRAEKFVDYMMQEGSNEKVKCVNISINPYHSLYAKSIEAQSKFQFIDAKKFKDMYIKRMANALHTFTPLLDNRDIEIGILSRAAFKKEISSKCNDKALCDIKHNIFKELKKMYKNDLLNGTGHIKTKQDMNKYLYMWEKLLAGADYSNGIEPLGRAETLFKKPVVRGLKIRKEYAMNCLNKTSDYLHREINPNGEVILVYNDISVRTSLGFNFENKNKEVKPFANEIENYVFDLEEV